MKKNIAIMALVMAVLMVITPVGRQLIAQSTYSVGGWLGLVTDTTNDALKISIVSTDADQIVGGNLSVTGTSTLAGAVTASSTVAVTGLVTASANVKYDNTTIAADDVTPDVSGGFWHTTSANTGATAITDLDNPVVGSIVCLVGGSATNSSTVADSGNFNLTAAFTAGLDDVLCLYVQADNDYIEVSRADN